MCGRASLQSSEQSSEQSNFICKPQSISSFVTGFKSAINSKINDFIDEHNFNPYHFLKRGANENTNGLIRQYFPKDSSFENISMKDVQRVQDITIAREKN